MALVLAPLALCATANAQSNWVDWSDETATRIIGDPTVTTADPEEKDMVAADFDNDGDFDVAIVRKVPFSTPGGRPNVLLMNENGVLTDRTSTLAPDFLIPDDARDVLAFDANGDGWVDLVVATTFFEQPRLFMNQGEIGGVWQGFASQPNWFSPLFSPGPKFCAVYDGDIDNDGDLDLFFSDYNSPLDDRLLINDGTGIFTDMTDQLMSNAASTSVFGTGSFICDFNKDGWNDILKGSGAFEPVKLILNDGTGHFNQVQTFNTAAAYMVRAVDFNNDDRMDFYVVDDGQDYIYINDSTNADGTIATTKIFVTNSNKTTGFGGNVHQHDLDLDGFADLGIADVDVDIPGCNRRFAALRNKRATLGVDGFLDPNNPTNLGWNQQGVHDFAYLDINGDGFQDMLVARCVGLRVWIMQPFAMPGSEYCQGGENSLGQTARIYSHGSASLAANDFRLGTQGGIRGQFGLFFYGSVQASMPFGGGTLCIGGSVERLNSPQLMGGTLGLSSRRVDFAIPPTSSGPNAITANSTWNFQWWYRDPTGPGGFNLSNAVSVTFTP